MGLGVGYVHVDKALSRRILGSICDVILSIRAHTPFESAMHLHGVTLHYNTTRPLPCYFGLRGLTPAHLRYAGVTLGASAF